MMAGLVDLDLDWAGARRTANDAVRPSRRPRQGTKGGEAKQYHSAIRWPTVTASAELRPSLRKVVSLPRIK